MPQTAADANQSGIGKPQFTKVSHKEVITELALQTPDMLLRALRFRLYVRLVRCDPPGLYSALLHGYDADRSWLRTVLDDFPTSLGARAFGALLRTQQLFTICVLE